MKRLSIIATMAAMVAVSGGLSANAGETQPTYQTFVSYSDLDLSKPSNAQILIDRITDAASSVCRKDVDVSKLIWSRLYQSCVKEAADRAVAKVDRPIVTALHSGQYQEMMASK